MAQQLVYLVQIRKENQIMKKTITTLAILLVLIGFEAEASQLILRTNNYSSKVIISGNSYFSNNGEFWVQQMPAGRHFITITDRGNRGDNRGQGRRNGQQLISDRKLNGKRHYKKYYNSCDVSNRWKRNYF